MKKLLLYTIFTLLGTLPLYATYSAVNLTQGTPRSAYRWLRCYVYTFGLDFDGDEAQPQRLKIFSGLGIDQVGASHNTGAPKWVEIITGYRDITKVSFPEGKALGKSRAVKGKQMTVELLDANENPTSGEPAFFHITDFNGSQYRLEARESKTRMVGFPVFIITPEGEKHLFKDSGFEILLDENGWIRQFRDLQDLYRISYPDNRTRVYDKYRIEQTLPEKVKGLYVLKEGSKPYKKYRLFHPESDQYKIMVQEKYSDGEMEQETTWIKGENPYLYKFQTRIPGQNILYRDDDYFKDENGILTLHRKYYRDEGKYQLDRKSQYIKEMGWQITYKWELEDGEETLDGYRYVDDWKSGKTLKLHTLHKNPDGKWFRKTFDDHGRVTMWWTPQEEEVPVGEGIEDTDVLALLNEFTAPATAKKKLRYVPENPPEDPEMAKSTGKVIYYAYDPHFSGDQVTAEDDRPRTVSIWEGGKFISREWFGYGTRANSIHYESYEWSDREEAQLGAETNRRRNKEFHPPEHPVAPGKLMSILHEDETLEVFYYDKGTFQKAQKFFQTEEKGKDLRIVSTRGKLKENNWTPGSRSRTRIEDENQKLLHQEKRVLQENGTWEGVKD